MVYNTNPNNADSDSDGLLDGFEIEATNPLSDTNQDGFPLKVFR